MNYVGKLFSNVKGFYNEINSATLTGALDVIVLELPDGNYISSPFHVRFGKLGVLRAREKVVDIECNNQSVEDLHMKLGEAGEAFFVEEFEEELEVPAHLATSPLPSVIDLMEQGIQELKKEAERADTETVDTDITPTEANINAFTNLQPEAQSDTSTKPLSENKAASDDLPHATSNKQDTSRDEDKDRPKSDSGLSGDEARGYSEVFEMDLSGEDEGVPPDFAQLPKPLVTSMSDRQAMTERWQYHHLTHEMPHAFSDTDLTPLASPESSRPSSPFSDTEFENSRLDKSDLPEDEIQWQWGELPARKRSDSTVTMTPASKEQTQDGTVETALEDKSSGGLFKFMRTTKKIRHHPEKEGIYLSDLNLDQMDPEVASLYLYKGSTHLRPIKDEDNESGRGASLPQSPVSMEREPRVFSPPPTKPEMFPYDVRLSLCGGLQESEGNIPMEKFMEGLVTYDDFVENPDLLTDPNLVVSVGGKYYNWASAASMIMAGAAFQRPLPDFAVDMVVKQHMPKKQQKKTGWWPWGGSAKQPDTAAADKGSKQEDKQEDADKTASSISPPSSVPSSPPNTPLKSKKKKVPTATLG